MSTLIEIDPSVEQIPEEDGHEYSYYAFDILPPMKTDKFEINEVNEDDKMDKELNEPKENPNLPQSISKLENLTQLQLEDPFCDNIIKQLNKGNLIERQPYFIEDYLLHRIIKEQDQQYEAIVIPRVMIGQVLKAAHDLLGHNGIGRTYAAVKKLYYWKGMKPVITKYIRNCYKCQQRNRQVIKYNKLHFDTASFPMEFISMDLIGEFHPPSKKGNKYALTVICMLTRYVFCVPLKSKTACEVIQAYIDNIYAVFGGSRKILSDNRTEFKNQMFENIAQELGVEYKKYTATHHPSSNGKIEGFHNFLKVCLAKHISGKLDWDEVIPLACAAYNFMPNENSRESPFFLMFARDPILPLNTLLSPKIRYMGNDHNIISLEAMKSMFELVTVNLKKARARKDPEHFPDVTQLQEGDTVMIKNHTAKAFEPKYVGDYRIIRITGHKVLLKSLKKLVKKRKSI